MLATGCAGVMIARAGVGQPWLIAKLTAEMNAMTYALPSHREIGSLFLEHVEKLIQLLGNEKFALLQARTFAKYYARTIADRAAFCEKMNTCETMPDLKKICQQYFIAP
jgi:tRNA-dihydrouridine synthase